MSGTRWWRGGTTRAAAYDWPLRWVPRLALVVTSLGALAVAGLVYWLDNDRERAHFTSQATDQMALLTSGTSTLFRPVRQIAATLTYAQGQIDTAAFTRLAQSITSAQPPSLMALAWRPRVTDAAGGKAFVLRACYRPPAPTAGADLDPCADPLSPDWIARTGGQPQLTLSPWYRAGNQIRLQTLRPVFRADPTGPGELLGLVVGVYRVDTLIEDVLSAIGPGHLTLCIEDIPGPSPGIFCYTGDSVRSGGADPRTAGASRRLEQKVPLYGEPGHILNVWRIVAVAEPGEFLASLWPPLLIALLGLIASGLLALRLRDLQTRERQVGELVVERTEELQAANRELEQFAYVASHDLKAPLRAVSQLAAWIAEDAGEDLDAENRERLRLLRERVIRMAQLIDGLLAYARAGGANADTSLPVALKPLLERLIGELPLPAGLRVEIQEPLPVLKADALHLRQIFQNLITNAASHHDHPESGTIWIHAEAEPTHWRLTVADDGPGIPAEERKRVFRLFTSLGPSAGEHHAGIGLAIVEKLVSSYGGRIDVTENRPRGAQFRILWPK